MNEQSEAPRCRLGSKTENPCTREGVQLRWPDDPRAVVCAEHARASALRDEEDDIHYALDKLEEYIQQEEANVSATLAELLVASRDEMQEKYARAHAKARAAFLIADYRHTDVTPEQAERLGVLLDRSDAFGNAGVVLGDLPESTFGNHDKWVILDVLVKARKEANEEFYSYKRKIGLEKPEEVGPEREAEHRASA